MHHELSAVSSPIVAIKADSNSSITSRTSNSFDITCNSKQKKRKIRESPTGTFSTDSFISVNSSILDDTVIKPCGPNQGLNDILKISTDTFNLVSKLHFELDAKLNLSGVNVDSESFFQGRRDRIATLEKQIKRSQALIALEKSRSPTTSSQRVVQFRSTPLDLSQTTSPRDPAPQRPSAASGSSASMMGETASSPRQASHSISGLDASFSQGPITSIRQWLELNLMEEGRDVVDDFSAQGEVGEITVGDKESAPGMAQGVDQSIDYSLYPTTDCAEPQYQRAKKYNDIIRTSITHERFLNHCLSTDVLPLYAYGLCPIPGFFQYTTPENKKLTDYRVEQGRELLRFLKTIFSDQRKRVARQLRADVRTMVSTMVRIYGADKVGAAQQCSRLDAFGNEVQRREEDERCQRFNKLPTREEAKRQMQTKVLGLPRLSVPGASRELEEAEATNTYPDDGGYGRRGRGRQGYTRGYSWRREPSNPGYRGRFQQGNGRGQTRGGQSSLALSREEEAEVRRLRASKRGGTGAFAPFL